MTTRLGDGVAVRGIAATPGDVPQSAVSGPVAPALAMTTGTQRAGLAAAIVGDHIGARQRVNDYVTLTKPRVVSLLLLTTLMPMIVAQGGWPSGAIMLWTAVGGYLMAGGANAVNMYLDRDLDARMTRTALRPIPSGRSEAAHVLAFGIASGSAAFALFWTLVNPASALLAAGGFLYYVFVYTAWLKRRTPQNIVIGGAAGAFPPLVGWAAVTGSLTPTPLLFFLIVFLWTPPHFWALALVKRKDYGAAMIPMAPNVWGENRTLRQMLGYTLLLIPVSVAPVAFGDLGWVYGVSAVLLGLGLLRDLARLARAPSATAPAWALYRSSLLYLALLFTVMALDTAVSASR